MVDDIEKGVARADRKRSGRDFELAIVVGMKEFLPRGGTWNAM